MVRRQPSCRAGEPWRAVLNARGPRHRRISTVRTRLVACAGRRRPTSGDRSDLLPGETATLFWLPCHPRKIAETATSPQTGLSQSACWPEAIAVAERRARAPFQAEARSIREVAVHARPAASAASCGGAQRSWGVPAGPDRKPPAPAMVMASCPRACRLHDPLGPGPRLAVRSVRGRRAAR